MNKILALIVCVGLSSCDKNLVDDMLDGRGGDFRVEALTGHRFPKRGREPLEIITQRLSYNIRKGEGTGVIKTNYGDIPVRFPYYDGVKVSSRLTSYITMKSPFFVQGGYIILTLSADGEKLATDSIAFDIIAPKSDIEKWGRGIK